MVPNTADSYMCGIGGYVGSFCRWMQDICASRFFRRPLGKSRVCPAGTYGVAMGGRMVCVGNPGARG